MVYMNGSYIPSMEWSQINVARVELRNLFSREQVDESFSNMPGNNSVLTSTVSISDLNKLYRTYRKL